MDSSPQDSKSHSRSYRRHAAGFTLIELTAAMAISLILAAVAVPNVVTGIGSMRLASTAWAASSLFQQTKLQSVSDDRNYTIKTASVANATVMYADLNGNGALDSGEPVVQVAGTVVPGASDAPSITSMSLDFTPQPATTPVSFNARGVPCVVAGTSCLTNSSGTTVGFVYFFSGQVNRTREWSAVSVSPSGRIRTWYWNGTSWKQR